MNIFCACTAPAPDALTDFGVMSPPIVVSLCNRCLSDGPLAATGTTLGEGFGFGVVVATGALVATGADVCSDEATLQPAMTSTTSNPKATKGRRITALVTAPSMPGRSR